MAESLTNFSVQIPKTITYLFLSYAKIHNFLFVCLCNFETEKQLRNGVLYLPGLFYISCMQSQGKRCWHSSTGQCMAPFSCHPGKVPCIVSSKFAWCWRQEIPKAPFILPVIIVINFIINYLLTFYTVSVWLIMELVITSVL